MQYNLTPLKKKVDEAIDWFSKELQGIRTGRATPLILDSVSVEAYGSRIPIRDIAAIGIEDPRTLRITPWDLSQSKSIEKAISVSGIGVSVSLDEKGLRVHFPELTAETRKALIKLVKDKQEQAKVTIRGERDNVWSDIQRKEKSGEISEDNKFRNKEEMQRIIDEGNRKLEELAEKKQTEVSS